MKAGCAMAKMEESGRNSASIVEKLKRILSS